MEKIFITFINMDDGKTLEIAECLSKIKYFKIKCSSMVDGTKEKIKIKSSDNTSYYVLDQSKSIINTIADVMNAIEYNTRR